MKKSVKPSPVEGTLSAPASKSYAQRAIAAATLADGISVLRGLTLCDDTEARKWLDGETVRSVLEKDDQWRKK